MISPIFIPLISILYFSHSPLILAQQPYIRKARLSCDTTNPSSPARGYTCNGPSRRCRAYLTFRAHHPFDSISTISKLMNSPEHELSRLNSLPGNETLPTGQMVLVPVTCTCSGRYYQANASYVVAPYDNYFVIANYTFQGLSTCGAVRAQNRNITKNLYAGQEMMVPLRCACPTKNQSNSGVKYLVSYLVTWKQYVSIISALFKVDTSKTLAANELTEQDSTIYPFTTLLIPLEDQPSSTQIRSLQRLPPPPPPAAPPPPSGSSRKTWIYAIAGAIGGFALASVSIAIVFFLKRKRKPEQDQPQVGIIRSEKTAKKEVEESISNISKSLKVYTIEELKAGTEDFSPNCLIKGCVYRGTINGDVAAIKRTSGDVAKEINLLDKIHHFNLIRLSGACYDQGHYYLVYEYASNGSLRDWIISKNRSSSGQKILNWNERLRIGLDVSTGLNYLHNYTWPPHVHKDLNSSNVVLDHHFRAKITNFSLARSADDKGFALTKHIVGTRGYMAPEYLENGVVSPKLDVYSFGILMLEILTGKEASLLYEEVEMQLSDILIPILQEEDGQQNLRRLMDPMLQEQYPAELALMVLKLISSCLKNNPSDRPNTDHICQSLSKILTSSFSTAVNINNTMSEEM